MITTDHVLETVTLGPWGVVGKTVLTTSRLLVFPACGAISSPCISRRRSTFALTVLRLLGLVERTDIKHTCAVSTATTIRGENNVWSGC